MHLHPPGLCKKLGVIRRNLQGNFVSAPQHTCTPQAEQESILGHFLLGGGYLEVYLVVLDRLLRATTKKSSTFLRKKCTPDKILATPHSVFALVVRPSVCT